MPSFEPRAKSEYIIDWMRRWLHSEALRDLLSQFNFQFLDGLEFKSEIDEIASFSRTNWDFRHGRERDLARGQQYVEEVSSQILASAKALGLMEDSDPKLKSYEHALILGGLVTACFLRPQRAASLVSSGLAVGDISAIGGFRPLGSKEKNLAASVGYANIDDEYDALDLGVRRAFDVDQVVKELGHRDLTERNESWSVRTYLTGHGSPIKVIAAPSSDPLNRRANTADTYRFWAENVIGDARDSRVLLITTSIYAPFQGLDALRMLALPYGFGIEVIGLGENTMSPLLPRQTFTEANYLQEINSTIQSIRALHSSLEASG